MKSNTKKEGSNSAADQNGIKNKTAKKNNATKLVNDSERGRNKDGKDGAQTGPPPM